MAKTWDIDTTSFDVMVDLSELLDRYGNGVYTVALWGGFGDKFERGHILTVLNLVRHRTA